MQNQNASDGSTPDPGSNRTVLIAEDDAALATALALRCRHLGVAVVRAGDGLEAYRIIREQGPDLAILDVNMPGLSGLRLIEELARDQRTAPLPVIVLTGQSDAETVAQCEQFGAHHVWKSLDTWQELEPLLRRLLGLDPCLPEVATPRSTVSRERGAAADADLPCVLVVDDDPNVSRALQVRLESLGARVLRAFSGMQGFWTALKEQPDVIISDFQMPDGTGSFLLGKLSQHPLTRGTPVIVITGQRFGGQTDFSLERQVLALGACCFLSKPFEMEALLAELRMHLPTLTAKTPMAQASSREEGIIAGAPRRGGWF